MSEAKRRSPVNQTGRRVHVPLAGPDLPMTADAARGSSNLATTPRAGNISSDTRAGRPG